MKRSISMSAILIGSNIVDGANVEKRAVTAIGEAQRVPSKAADAYLQNTVSETRVKALLTWLFGSIGRRFERRRQADIERLSRPLSLDEAWVGGWYGRSRVPQDGLLHKSLNAGGKAKPEPKSWDDRLD
jgi:hypothetical protein